MVNRYTVYVYGIFTNGTFSSENRNQCLKRFKQDVRSANQTWKVEGTSIIHFVPGGIFTTDQTINAATMTGSEAIKRGGPVYSLIQEMKRHTNNRSAIYVAYLSGDFFAGGRRTVGVAIPDFEDFRSGTEYKLFGHIALSDKAANTFTFAHEAGHILFTRYHATQNRFICDDPSGPHIHPLSQEMDPTHNNDKDNLMYPAVPLSNPIITPQQCKRARKSMVVIVE